MWNERIADKILEDAEKKDSKKGMNECPSCGFEF